MQTECFFLRFTGGILRSPAYRWITDGISD